MLKVDELKQERYKLVKQARELLTKAETEKRNLSAEENSQYDRMMADVDKMKVSIDEEGKRSALSELEAEAAKATEKAVMPVIGNGNSRRASKEYGEAFRTYLSATSKPEEARALQMDLDSAGGYTVAPQQFVTELLKEEDVVAVMRRISRKFTVATSESLGVPTLENNPTDPTWTTELGTGSEDSTMSFGKRELRPYPLALREKVSKKLIRASALGVEGLVRDRLAYKAGYVEDNAFLNGSGANQPLGVFTASALGINTGQDVSTGNTTTEIRADGLIEAKYAMRSAYWPGATWLFHQNAIKQIRKLRGNDGDFLWKPGLANDRGDMILDIPVLTDELVPHTFTTGAYVGILGDFRYYWIADALDTTIQVLVELYAETNQNGYILRKECDGMPVLEEAFVRVTLA